MQTIISLGMRKQETYSQDFTVQLKISRVSTVPVSDC